MVTVKSSEVHMFVMFTSPESPVVDSFYTYMIVVDYDIPVG